MGPFLYLLFYCLPYLTCAEGGDDPQLDENDDLSLSASGKGGNTRTFSVVYARLRARVCGACVQSKVHTCNVLPTMRKSSPNKDGRRCTYSASL